MPDAPRTQTVTTSAPGLRCVAALPDAMSMEIRGELYRHACEHGLTFDQVLRRYATERFLHRMETKRRGQRALRGAWAMEVRLGVQHRRWTTIQLLDRKPLDLADVNKRAFWLIEAAADAWHDDALRIDLNSARWSSPADHGAAWIRYKLFGYLQQAQLPLQIDIRYDNDVSPAPEEMEIPSLLDQPWTTMPVYCFDALAAEKLVTIIQRGVLRFRARDYYDLWLMTQVDPLDDLGKALEHMLSEEDFKKPDDVPSALTDKFATSEHAKWHWRVFLDRGGPLEKVAFRDVVAGIRDRVMPDLDAVPE